MGINQWMVMDMLPAEYIKQTLLQLKSAIRDNDVEKYKHLFTNDFAFWLFKQYIPKIRDDKVIDMLVGDEHHNNMFYIASDCVFGVNDDGKIFAICGIATRSLSEVYSAFGYDIDIVDQKFPTTFNGTEIRVFIPTSELLKYQNSVTMRITGDLLIRFDTTSAFKMELCLLFQSYLRQLISLELSKNGIISEDNRYISFPKRCANFEMYFHSLINMMRDILKSCGFTIVDENFDDKCAQLFFNFTNIKWVLQIEYNDTNFSYQIAPMISYERMHYDQIVSNQELLRNIFEFIGIPTDEQMVIANLGNHKIIIRGFNLPIMKIGDTRITFGGFIAKQIIFEHPEHITTEVHLDDYQVVNFSLIQMPLAHQCMRNIYVYEQRIQHGKI
jgi:hypothetical protein